ncbi:outer envelope pore protein 24B, chloroplastic-like isoform X2 [Humulus lupulus]|uniref:outer envelope pore protein 24B, chloroplastic-like isoform X2 n=1 Tax=Humulus lupulus TaxID=3486 RepID=UPI002B407EDD|nr:outer envelope pore protein 24B, chloroplastic-like isoform X2 [Humulus lupulus]
MNAAISFTGGSNTAKEGVVGTVALNAGDVRLRASTTTPAVLGGPGLPDLSLSLSVEKPGAFVIDYDVPNQDVRFQFMNRVNVLNKQLNLTYSHTMAVNQNALDATLLIDSTNKLWGSYGLGSGDCKVKYSYVQGGLRTFEPCYDVIKNSWDISVSQRILDGDVIRAFYGTSSKVLGLELLWQGLNRDGRFKVLNYA